jgi:single-stranded-DNA-specific exonuclease
MEKKWEILKPDNQEVTRICRRLKCSPVLATVLANRNVVSPEDTIAFFDSSFQRVSSPFCVKDIKIAADRICSAIKNREKILIFGDYDVDGITATAIFYRFLIEACADVSYYIPHRILEGYGMRTRHISEVAVLENIDLIITVDCGISSHDAIEAANDAGIDVIVTDHHRVTEDLPKALAVINPNRSDCESGLEHLAGVGVAFYLLIAVRKRLREMKYWDTCPEPNLKDLCDLVALGTVADLVPLVAENRILVKNGLEILRRGKRAGIQALIDICGLADKPIESDDITFRLAPRLNAAGRMHHAKLAVELLLTEDAGYAVKTARNLGKLNLSRQIIEKEIFEDIEKILHDSPAMLDRQTIVLSHRNWHAGLLGIVASKVAGRFYRPVVLISEKESPCKGSARGIPEMDLYQLLESCSGSLEAFGGHKMAAGLTIMPQNIDRFRKDFETITERMSHSECFAPTLLIDKELTLSEISDRLMDEIESLHPFGTRNPEPLFMATDVRVHFSSMVGKNHRRMSLCQSNGKPVNSIQFNVPPELSKLEKFDRMAFYLRRNHWNGRKTVQVVIEDVVG